MSLANGDQVLIIENFEGQSTVPGVSDGNDVVCNSSHNKTAGRNP